MRFKAIVPAASCLAVMMSGHAMAGTFEKTATGVVVKPDAGAKEVRLEVMSDSIIHVVKTDKEGKELTPSLMTVAAPVSGIFSVTASGTAAGSATAASSKTQTPSGNSSANCAATSVAAGGAPGKTTLTADQALARLQEGNRRFVADMPMNVDMTRKRRLELARGQGPFAALVGCSDSRVGPEQLFKMHRPA